MNFSQAFLVYKNTLQKEVRSKVLLFLTIITIGFILLFSQILSFFSDELLSQTGMGSFGNTIMSFFMGGIGFWNFFLSVFLGVNTVRTDLESCVASQLLSFPIKRFEYLMSRILGVFTIVMGFYLLSVGLAILTFSTKSGVIIGSWDLLLAIFINSFSLLATVTLAVAISLHFGKLTSLVSTYVLVLLISLANSYFQRYALLSVFEDFSLIGIIGAFLHALVPHIGTLNTVTGAIIAGQEASISVWLESGHYLGSFIFLFFCTAFFFRKKEI